MDPQAFLKLIALLESSGGKNMNHAPIDSGIQAGSKAVGKYGLMPNTIDEMNNRAKGTENYGPDNALYDKLPPEEKNSFVEDNPQFQELTAEQLAERNLNKTSNPDKAAYMWNMGHNLNPKEIDKNSLNSSPYVKKFRKLKQSLNKI